MPKTYVITGASTGIGEAIALAYAARGENVVVAARGEGELARVVALCEKVEGLRAQRSSRPALGRDKGGKAMAVKTDVTDPESCKALVEKTIARFGGIDVFVCNAGISMWARFREVTDFSIFERIMNVNYLGMVNCVRFALPELEKSRGLLVGVSSLTGIVGVPTRSGYAASKHAMQGFLDSLRIELDGTGVDVCVISPGFVATDIRGKALGPDGTPRAESPRDESKGTMSLEECTRICVRAIDRRDRDAIMTARAKFGRVVRLFAPAVIDRIAARAVRERGD